jgi:hypothetical protein
LSRPAELSGTRWFAVGAVLGLLTSGLLVGTWYRDARGLSVTVLGAGRQASVLVTSHHRRILIAAGTNGASFSNALADALPPMDKELDVVLVDPEASVDVRDRARALESRVIWTLPEAGDPADVNTVERSFSIEFDKATRFRLTIDSEGGWHAELIAAAGTIFITPDAQSVTDHLGSAVAVLTHAHEFVEFSGPLLVALPGVSTEPDQQLRVAQPGSAVRLDLSDDQIRVNAA